MHRERGGERPFSGGWEVHAVPGLAPCSAPFCCCTAGVHMHRLALVFKALVLTPRRELWAHKRLPSGQLLPQGTEQGSGQTEDPSEVNCPQHCCGAAESGDFPCSPLRD